MKYLIIFKKFVILDSWKFGLIQKWKEIIKSNLCLPCFFHLLISYSYSLQYFKQSGFLYNQPLLLTQTNNSYRKNPPLIFMSILSFPF